MTAPIPKPPRRRRLVWTGSNMHECAAFLGDEFVGVEEAIEAVTGNRLKYLLVRGTPTQWHPPGTELVRDNEAPVRIKAPM